MYTVLIIFCNSKKINIFAYSVAITFRIRCVNIIVIRVQSFAVSLSNPYNN